MITLKSAHEIELMRRAGKITAAARALARDMVKPGVTTAQIDKAVFQFIKDQGATPSFLHYNGYPASVCVSVNDEIIHGIPGKRVLQEGDIVSVDVGAFIGGFHGDCAGTYPCGQVSDEALRLIRVTQQSFFEGIKFAREGCRLSDISAAVQAYVEANGFSIVREYVGHGIGRRMHEPPEVPNYGKPGHGPRLLRGMTIAVEPMVNAGSAAIAQMPDGWTVKTADGKNAEMDGKNKNTDHAKEELRDGDADHTSDRQDVITNGTLLQSTEYPEDTAQHGGDDQRCQRQLQRCREVLLQQGGDRLTICQRIAKVPAKQLPQPLKVLHEERIVQAVQLTQLLQLCRVNVCQLIRREHIGDRISRGQIQSQVDQEGDKQHHWDHKQELF